MPVAAVAAAAVVVAGGVAAAVVTAVATVVAPYTGCLRRAMLGHVTSVEQRKIAGSTPRKQGIFLATPTSGCW